MNFSVPKSGHVQGILNVRLNILIVLCWCDTEDSINILYHIGKGIDQKCSIQFL